MAKDETKRKNCETCQKLRDPANFMAGAQVRIADLGDCEECEVTRSQPSNDNEIIIEAYEILPRNYDGFTGAKLIHLSEVKEIFKMLGVSERRFDDVYLRLMYFHGELTRSLSQRHERKPKTSSGDQDFSDLAAGK
jgi:hypothetical protein